MANYNQKKILRVALLRKGEVFDEKLLRTPQPVTIGTDIENTFCSPLSAELPNTFILFDHGNESYVLRIPEGMVGKISLGQGIQPLSEVLKRGSRDEKGIVSLPLPEDAFGTLMFRSDDAEHKVMFKFVVPPPGALTYTLPESLQGGPIADLSNPLLFTGILISCILQGAFLAYIIFNDWPKPREMDRVIPDRFVTILMDMEKKEEEPPPPPEENQEGDGKDAAGDENQKPLENEPPVVGRNNSDDSELSPAELERRRKLTAEVRSQTVLGQLGALAEGGSLADSLSGGVKSMTMEEAFAGSTGVKLNAGVDERSGLRTGGNANADGTGTAVGMGNVGGGGTGIGGKRGVITTAAKQERQINIKSMAEKVVGGQLDSASIASVIARRMSRIRACYERQLKKNPLARGKVVVQFTIGTVGRVTDSKAVQDSVGGGVGMCVAQEIERMRFPQPSGGPATVSKSFVFEANQ